MKIYLHIGVPKTGSTAIQAHLALNKRWLSERSIIIPETGHSEGYGHVLLFEDNSGELLAKLTAELAPYKDKPEHTAILSFEGLNTFKEDQLEVIKNSLSGHKIIILAYLREQTEVIQSGYFQAVKQRPQKRLISDFESNDHLINLPHIDYQTIFGRYGSVFGKDSIKARIYRRELLKDKNIVLDFLDFIRVTDYTDFILAKTEQNISLDLGSVQVMNIIDSLSIDANKREQLISILLCEIVANGPDQKYFLSEARKAGIRQLYQKSNKGVIDAYVDNYDGENFPVQSIEPPNTPSLDLAAKKMAVLNTFSRFTSWDGECISGTDIAQLTPLDGGWSRPEEWGVWSSGEASIIRFRISPNKVSPHYKQLKLSIKGFYFSDNNNTIVTIKGLEKNTLSLVDNELTIPLTSFDSYGCIEIYLEHQNPCSPKELGQGDDSRKIAFAMKELKFIFD
jgi:hypothetical protein